MSDTPPLVCYYGTPWLDHFEPPAGTGKGCPACEAAVAAAIAARRG